jgi:hypothetical protein
MIPTLGVVRSVRVPPSPSLPPRQRARGVRARLPLVVAAQSREPHRPGGALSDSGAPHAGVLRDGQLQLTSRAEAKVK